ncbi:uridine kinase family protein [Streptomyces hainanensis]|uniref:Phosphoribulokinase/uridine kinase domain-containing protein n=1 Tax=Streptomyces hainanensis TaxID=402648 RepID=A0A4R4TEY9_9ACTN|nr:hypothetical protein [Streptomyces hainanensis]TDC75987.1 hypothetical protein E1283_10860 [Streptomyces hainanensis]
MLITLSGGAGAGKTTLATALAGHAGRAGPARMLHGDDYYVTGREHGSWLPDENGLPRLDVGDPRSMDFARLDADVDAALTAAPRPVAVIVEGMFAFRCRPSATAGPRLDVFVDLAADLRLARKIHRQCVRGDFPVAVLLANYLNLRRAAFARHVEPARAACDLVVDGELPAAALAERVWAATAVSRGGGSSDPARR